MLCGCLIFDDLSVKDCWDSNWVIWVYNWAICELSPILSESFGDNAENQAIGGRSSLDTFDTFMEEIASKLNPVTNSSGLCMNGCIVEMCRIPSIPMNNRTASKISQEKRVDLTLTETLAMMWIGNSASYTSGTYSQTRERIRKSPFILYIHAKMCAKI